MKYLEMVKIHKNFKQRPHAQLLARGEKLKNFSSIEQHCMICDIYNLFFDTARLSFYHNENGDFQQETLIFLL